MAHQLTDYLDREAARVRVDDTLDEIESGVSHVAVVDVRSERPRRGLAFAGAAAAVGLLAFVGVARSGSSPAIPGAAADEPAPVTAIVEVPVTTTTLPPQLFPLPVGATMQGLVPMCTTTDGVEFDCAVEDYRRAGGYDDHGIDHTGEVQAVISEDSIVSGGCRSTSADGSTWHCALGQRSVELEMIGAGFLGEHAPPGYTAG
ncbi:MAG: hypothetical protein QM733_13930 [Ilumatobacteraceae bacterium]